MKSIDPEIPERFEVREELYRSEQNVRLRAFDKDLELEVVLEYSGGGARELAPSANERRNALRQARMRAKVRHDKIQPLKEIVETPQAVIHVLEPRAGQTLTDLLKECGTLGPDEVIDLGVELAGALQALHAEGVVHRAVAADNILMIGAGEMSALSGFAFAKPIEGFGQSSLQYNPTQKESAAAKALPHHPAPEQVAGQAADARSDIFAVGCVLYQCLTARPAFADHAASWVEPTNPQQLAPDIPKELGAVIMKCLRHSPMSRIPTMLQLHDELLAAKRKTKKAGAARASLPAWMVAAAAVVLAASVWMVAELVREDATPGSGSAAGGGRSATPSPTNYAPSYRKSYAILIGINYKGNDAIQTLQKPEEDIAKIDTALRALGFETIVITGPDATKKRIEGALHGLQKKLHEDDQVLIYFAGHGALHSFATQNGFFLPFEADKKPAGQGSALNWIRFRNVSDYLVEYKAKHVLLALDCCHSGSVFDQTRGEGLVSATVKRTQGAAAAHLTKPSKVIMVSCQGDDKASDVSFFAQAFQKKLQQVLSTKAPVSHTEIYLEATHLGNSGGFLQVPSVKSIDNTEAAFYFMPPKQK